MARPRYSRRFKVPLRPYDKDRLIEEIKLVGEFGLKNKKELWTIKKICDDFKKRSKDLLISTNQDELIVKGRILLSKLVKLGILNDVGYTDLENLRSNLEKVLSITPDKFLERRLQQRVFEIGLAKSVHHARHMIAHKHISVKGDIVNTPGYMVREVDEGYIEMARNSSLNGEKLGRSKRRRVKAGSE